MLVDQIAAGYWRTIRARRFETAMFDNHLRTKKLAHGKDPGPNERDDEGCAVILQVTDPEAAQELLPLRRHHLARLLPRHRHARKDAGRPPPRRRSPGTQSRDRKGVDVQSRQLGGSRTMTHQATANTPLNPIGFVSYYEDLASLAEPDDAVRIAAAGVGEHIAGRTDTTECNPGDSI